MSLTAPWWRVVPSASFRPQQPISFSDGQPLSSLNDRSIEWYATPKEPRLNKQGQPFPPRPADEQLANAARQLYHAKRGTLVGKPPVAEMNFAPGSAADSGGSTCAAA